MKSRFIENDKLMKIILNFIRTIVHLEKLLARALNKKVRCDHGVVLFIVGYLSNVPSWYFVRHAGAKPLANKQNAGTKLRK